MKLYLDSADVAQWQIGPGIPSVAGVTTNPSLVHQAGLAVTLDSYVQLIGHAGRLGVRELMLQLPRPAVSDADATVQRLIAAAAQAQVNLTIKLPCHPDWTAALRCVQGHGLPVLLTGLANAVQLLWALDMGARWVAPYLGRLDDAGRDVWALVAACVAAQRQGTQLLAASIRSPEVLARLLGAGAAAATVRPEQLRLWASDVITQDALAQFERDIAASGGVPAQQTHVP